MAFAWNLPTSAAVLPAAEADWQQQAGCEVNIDPYLFWAEQSGFNGYLSDRDGRRRFAIELDDDAKRNAVQMADWLRLANAGPNSVEIAPLYKERLQQPRQPLRFFTAKVALDQVVSRFAPCFFRLKAGLVGSAETKAAPFPVGSTELAWPRLKRLLRDSDLAAVRRLMYANLIHGGATSQWPTLHAPAPNDAENEPAAAKAVMGIIDFGCPFAHQHFLDARGATRIRRLWDQGRSCDWPTDTGLWTLPTELGYGREVDAQRLDQCMGSVEADVQSRWTDRPLFEQACYTFAGLPELLAPWTHGAAVMDVAAGRGFALPGQAAVADAASDTEVIFVQLPESAVNDLSGGWLTVYVIDAIEYILLHARDAAQVVINVSLGSFAGSHDGASLLEAALECYAGDPRVAIVLAAGNVPTDRAVHAGSAALAPGQAATLCWEVPASDPTQNFLELWYQWDNGPIGTVQIDITTPYGGHAVTLLDRGARVLERSRPEMGSLPAVSAAVCSVLLIPGTHSGGRHGMALLATAPTRIEPAVPGWPLVAPSGRWKVQVSNASPAGHKGHLLVDAWVERDEPETTAEVGLAQSFLSVEPGGGFALSPRPGTMTGQCGGSLTYVVGNYVTGRGVIADDSAVGPLRGAGAPPRPGPDLVAPGACWADGQLRGLTVAANISGRTTDQSGTSLSAPWVSRALINWLAQGGANHLRDKEVVLSGLLGAARATVPDPAFGLGGIGPDGRGYGRNNLP